MREAKEALTERSEVEAVARRTGGSRGTNCECWKIRGSMEHRDFAKSTVIWGRSAVTMSRTRGAVSRG